MLNGRIVLATLAPRSQRTAEEHLGLGYLAASLRNAGYTVTIIDGWLMALTLTSVAAQILGCDTPLWVGLSCYRSDLNQANTLIQLLRAQNLMCPLVAGGYGPTFHPREFLLSGIDVVVRGEAEQTVVDLSRHYQRGIMPLETIQGISFLRDGQQVDTPLRPVLEDLESLPFPARDTLALTLDRRNPAHVLTARGCAAHCTFCSVISFARLSQGSQWRQRSIRSIVDEIEQLVAKGCQFIKIIDDSLIEPPRDDAWCAAFADELHGRGLHISLRGSIRADRVNSTILAELKRAGFVAFSCGIENFSQSALRRMGKTADIHNNIQALDAFKSHSLYVQAGHILFDMATTLQELWENLHGMRKYTWTISKGIFTEMYAAEGTPYTKQLERQNLLVRQPQALGNHAYVIHEPVVRNVYNALKKWHTHHARLYDKTIDPISAPKALNPSEMALFHHLSILLRQQDLDLFETLLHMAEAQASSPDMVALVETAISRTNDWYAAFSVQVEQAYYLTHLRYDAEENPFL